MSDYQNGNNRDADTKKTNRLVALAILFVILSVAGYMYVSGRFDEFVKKPAVTAKAS